MAHGKPGNQSGKHYRPPKPNKQGSKPQRPSNRRR